jgi:hypothetical protein
MYPLVIGVLTAAALMVLLYLASFYLETKDGKASIALTTWSSKAPSAHAGHQHIVFESPEDLAKAMQRAADAHHIYEQTNGKDENWPKWYASYMAEEFDES